MLLLLHLLLSSQLLLMRHGLWLLMRVLLLLLLQHILSMLMLLLLLLVLLLQHSHIVLRLRVLHESMRTVVAVLHRQLLRESRSMQQVEIAAVLHLPDCWKCPERSGVLDDATEQHRTGQ